MKYLTKSIILLFVFIYLASCSTGDNHSITLKGVNTINIQNGQITTTSILIENSLIKEIGEFHELSKNNNGKVIDCMDKYVIPGLFDMHTHISEHDNPIPNLDQLLTHGITSIRDLGGIVDTVYVAEEMIKSGQIKGPDIYFAGVTLDGPQSNDPFHFKVFDTTDLKKLTLDLKNKGVDLLKVHNYFPIDRLVELEEVANKSGLKIAGHIPLGVGPMELDSVGITSVEHMNSLLSGLIFKESNHIDDLPGALEILDSVYVSKLSEYFKENRIAFTPTLNGMNGVYSELEGEAARSMGIRLMRLFHQITLWMNQNGVLLLAGSDMGPINDTTVLELHKELEMMVKSGLSPLDALKTATINPSIYLEIDEVYGSLEVNKKANLIVLNSNPLADISNTKDIYFVLKDGALFNYSN